MQYIVATDSDANGAIALLYASLGHYDMHRFLVLQLLDAVGRFVGLTKGRRLDSQVEMDWKVSTKDITICGLLEIATDLNT